jgi:hypothetical protein
MPDTDPMQIEWTHHRDYYAVVLDSWRRIQKLQQQHDALQAAVRSRKITDADAAELGAINDAIGQWALVVVIFGALALEAYINDYAITRLSRNYQANYLDKLDVVVKWMVVPRLVTGKELDPGSTAFQGLSWLVGLRNKLAHYKSKRVTVEEIKDSDFLWYEDADRTVRTVGRLLSDLQAIDPEADTGWLEQRTPTEA